LLSKSLKIPKTIFCRRGASRPCLDDYITANERNNRHFCTLFVRLGVLKCAIKVNKDKIASRAIVF